MMDERPLSEQLAERKEAFRRKMQDLLDRSKSESDNSAPDSDDEFGR